MVNYGVNGVIGADPLSIQGRKRGKKRCPKYKFYATSMRADDTAPLSLFSFVREWHTSPRIIFPPFHILFCALQYYCVTHTLALQDTLPDTAFSCPLTTTVLLSVLMIKSSSFHIPPQYQIALHYTTLYSLAKYYIAPNHVIISPPLHNAYIEQLYSSVY